MQALEALRDEQGLLRPEAVVEAASHHESVLHGHFEWDDSKAAFSFRIAQARTLIRSERIPIRIGAITVSAPAWVPASATRGAYQRLDEIESGSAHAHAVIMDELQRVAGILGRARRIAAVIGLEQELDELLQAATEVRSRAASMTEPAE